MIVAAALVGTGAGWRAAIGALVVMRRWSISEWIGLTLLAHMVVVWPLLIAGAINGWGGTVGRFGFVLGSVTGALIFVVLIYAHNQLDDAPRDSC